MPAIHILDVISINIDELVSPLNSITLTNHSINPNGNSLSDEELLHEAIRIADINLTNGNNVYFYLDSYEGMVTTAIRSLALDHDVKIYHTLMEIPLIDLHNKVADTALPEHQESVTIKYTRLHKRLHALNRAAGKPNNDPMGYSVRFVEYNGITEKL